jgi:hypothetical protein
MRSEMDIAFAISNVNSASIIRPSQHTYEQLDPYSRVSVFTKARGIIDGCDEMLVQIELG